MKVYWALTGQWKRLGDAIPLTPSNPTPAPSTGLFPSTTLFPSLTLYPTAEPPGALGIGE